MIVGRSCVHRLVNTTQSKHKNYSNITIISSVSIDQRLVLILQEVLDMAHLVVGDLDPLLGDFHALLDPANNKRGVEDERDVAKCFCKVKKPDLAEVSMYR